MAEASLARRLIGALLLAPAFALLAWTVLWYLLHGASVIEPVVTPWAAAGAYLAWPDGAAIDPALGGSGLVALALGIGVAVVLLTPPTPPLHGDARFASLPEIRRAKLVSPSGVLLGRTGGLSSAYLRHAGPMHLLLAAPTRSGKGVGIVTPNLLSWPGSAVVLDIKNENFETTSGYRAACGQKVYRFAPGDPSLATHRYNPLDAVRRDPAHRIADLQSVAHLLTPDAAGEQKMWNQEARNLFVGLCLFILDSDAHPLTFGEVSRVLAANVDLRDALADVLERRHAELDPACVNLLSSFIHKAPKERSGVKSTLTGALELWADPAIDAVTATSDFSFAEFRRTPSTLYVSVSLDQLERVAFLLNIVFQQLVGVASRPAAEGAAPVPLLILIDEFASLGRMDTVVDKMPFLAGFGVRLLLVIQGLAQLDRLYGSAARELILQNAGLQVYFAANDEQTSAYVSNRLGKRTVIQKTRSRSTSAFGQTGTVTRGQALHARPLLTPDEVRRLRADEAILFVEGARPVRARKIVHYRDRRFVARLRVPVAVAPIEVPRHAPFVFRPPAGTPAAAPAVRVEPDVPPAAPAVLALTPPVAPAPPPRRPRAKTVPTLDQLDFGRLLRGPDAPAGP